MNVTSYEAIEALRRRWWIIVSGVVIGLAGASAYVVILPPEYRATAYLISVDPSRSTDAPSLTSASQVYARIATHPPVLALALKYAPADFSLETLKRAVSVETSPNAPLIAVSAEARRALLAARIADAVSRAISEFSVVQATITGYRVQRLASAQVPTSPARPNLKVSLVLGIASGLFVSSLVAFAVTPGRPYPHLGGDVVGEPGQFFGQASHAGHGGQKHGFGGEGDGAAVGRHIPVESKSPG